MSAKNPREIISHFSDFIGVSPMMHESLRQSLISLLEYVEESLQGRINKRKPDHGPCCTCQTCGFSTDDDDCRCEKNAIVEGCLSDIREIKNSI